MSLPNIFLSSFTQFFTCNNNNNNNTGEFSPFKSGSTPSNRGSLSPLGQTVTPCGREPPLQKQQQQQHFLDQPRDRTWKKIPIYKSQHVKDSRTERLKSCGLKRRRRRSYLLKGVLVCDVVHQHGAVGISVVDGTQSVEPLLTGCVLHTHTHTKLTRLQFLRCR